MPTPSAPGLVLSPGATIGERVTFGANVVVHPASSSVTV